MPDCQECGRLSPSGTVAADHAGLWLRSPEGLVQRAHCRSRSRSDLRSYQLEAAGRKDSGVLVPTTGPALYVDRAADDLDGAADAPRGSRLRRPPVGGRRAPHSKPYSGPKTITTAGTVIDGADIRGGLTIKANEVTITRSRIAAGGGASYVVFQSSGYSGLTIKDTEVMNLAGQVADRAISFKGTNMTLTRAYVHGTQRGIETGQYTTIRDSYSDDFNNDSGNHATGVMSLGGTDHVVLRHNAFGCGTGECSSAMSVDPQNDSGGPNDDWTISGNLFNGGGYCVHLGYTPADRNRRTRTCA
jgi:hypothetical protein